MTRDDLELVLRREGLTQPQTHAALQAADAYAQTQARHAIDAMYEPPPVHLWRGDNKTVCGLPNANLVNTTNPRQVTCDQCRTALKAAS
jgi:Tfp pilus assembly protein PilV